MSIDGAIDGLKRIFRNYELDLPCTDSLDVESEIIALLEEQKMYKSLAPRKLVSEKQKNDRSIEYSKGFEYGFKTGYSKSIDDFVKALQEKIEKDLANHDLALECKKCGIWKNYDIKEIAEQLKAGGVDAGSI